MKTLWTSEHAFVALCGLICIIITTHMGHAEVSSNIAFLCAAVSGSQAAKEILFNKAKGSSASEGDEK